MTEPTIPARSAIAPEHTWNAPSVFESDAAWEAEFKQIAESLPEVGAFQGKLGDSAAALAEALEARDALLNRINKAAMYAAMAHLVDTTNQAEAGRYSQAQGLFGRVVAAVAYVEPELIAVGEATLQGWMQAERRLQRYAHYFHNLFRQQAHVRSAEVEEVIGLLGDPFSSVSNAATLLTDADFTFAPAHTQDGRELAVTQGTFDKILAGPDREARRTAWENYADSYLAHKNTLAALLATSIKQNVFQMRVRRHPTTLAASLFDNNIPVEVFHNLINTFRKNLPTWHRYWAIRRKALGVETLHPYDIWAPLADEKPALTYEQIVDWVCQGLAPMGDDYVRAVRKGCLEERWVDIYPNEGKTSGAFSYGSQGTHPFILMSFDDTIFSLSTLAHELGHSMHSYLTWKNQPFIYSRYSLFLAEVASNFHQALVRAHLLQNNPDPAFQISVIEEAMANFHRYFFIMPTLARFELETHERAERGEGLTADGMNGLMADLFTEAYGGEMHVDRERVGITWATFGHLYADYYVYQYATGISGAHALSRHILNGEPGAVEAYLDFLKAGSSAYPLDVLKRAGVDLTTPQPVEETFEILAGMVDRLESLLGK